MTLQAKDLRIANYITKSIATIYRVEGVLHDNVFTEGYNIPASEFSGIPLTEEWLTKFGFEHYEDQELWNHECLCISYNPIAYKGFKFYANHEYEIGTAFHYVHQLQNLYFALTGQELTIKEGKEWERNHSETERKDL